MKLIVAKAGERYYDPLFPSLSTYRKLMISRGRRDIIFIGVATAKLLMHL